MPEQRNDRSGFDPEGSQNSGNETTGSSPAGSEEHSFWLKRKERLKQELDFRDDEDSRMLVPSSLELGPGARFNLKNARFKDIRIRPEARISIRRKLVCRNLYVEGELRATVQSEGMVRVRCGGFLKGSVATEHLAVESGGGLKARLKVTGSGAHGRNREESAAQQAGEE